MAALKTLPNNNDPKEFILSLTDTQRREDSLILLELFQEMTGEKPKMWGSSIIGYGMYHYKSERSSQEGDWPLVAFAPRKQNLTLYFMPSVLKLKALIDTLGKCKTSDGSCLYINKLSEVNLSTLKQIIAKGYETAKKELL